MRNLLPLTLIILVVFSSFGDDFSVIETSFENDSNPLYADIFIPHKPITPKTGISLIQGSGNSDRTNLWSRSFAAILAEKGYYVLLPDKRGCGKSKGDWKTASFEDLSTDATASVKHLKDKMSLHEVGIMGLSQGGFIAPIAANQDRNISFVINIVGASVTLEEQIIHEVTNTARKSGLHPNEIMEVLDLHVLMKQYALDKNWAPLGERFARLEFSSWSKFSKTFPNQPNLWVWNWIRKNIDFNPITYWQKVKQDVFVAYGSKDQDDNMPVFESIYRLQKSFKAMNKENYQIKVYSAGHALYEDDKPVIRKEFIDDLTEWLSNR